MAQRQAGALLENTYRREALNDGRLKHLTKTNGVALPLSSAKHENVFPVECGLGDFCRSEEVKTVLKLIEKTAS